MQKHALYFAFLLFFGCSGPSNGPQYDLTGFDKESIGGGADLVSYKASDGTYLAKGSVINGVRNGSWQTYHPGKNMVQTLTTYVNGRKNGIEITFNDRGQIEAVVEYKNDVLHGLSAKYNFGRPTEEITYKDGVMDGPFVLYNNRGQVQRKGSFLNGQQHGTLQYFNEEGQVTLEYEYKNGEKISGGMVDSPE